MRALPPPSAKWSTIAWAPDRTVPDTLKARRSASEAAMGQGLAWAGTVPGRRRSERARMQRMAAANTKAPSPRATPAAPRPCAALRAGIGVLERGYPVGRGERAVREALDLFLGEMVRAHGKCSASLDLSSLRAR